MKKIILISGIICLNIFVAGVFMKVFHLNSADIVITIGMASFALLFLPAAVINSYHGSEKTKKGLYIAGFICAVICIIGALFKIEQWNGSTWFLMIGIPLPFILFLPIYIHHHNKEKNKSVMNFAKIMFLMIFIALSNSLLTYRISGNIVLAYTNDSKGVFTTGEIAALKNSTLREQLFTSKDSNLIAVEEITKRSDAICKSIDEMQTALIQEVYGEQPLSVKEFIDRELWVKVRNVKSNSVIFGSENEPNRTVQLKKSINEYCAFITKLTFVNQTHSEQINQLLNTSDKAVKASDGSAISWEYWNFKNLYLITVLTKLEDVKTKIKLAENSVLEML